MAREEWLSTKAAADALGVPVRVLYRMIDQGHLPAYKFGRLIRLLREDIDAYLDGGTSGTSGIGR